MNFEINSEGGWIIPSGTVLSEAVNVPDYSEIGNSCRFDANCKFGRYATFGNDCEFGNSCRFDAGCEFGNSCEFGISCTFDTFCRFGAGCVLGLYNKVGTRAIFLENCMFGSGTVIKENGRFGVGCVFADDFSISPYSKFEKGCSFGRLGEFGGYCKFTSSFLLRGTEVSRMFSLANVDGSGRSVIVARTVDNQLVISAGCFFGTVDTFCEKAEGEGKLVYSAVVRAAAEAFFKATQNDSSHPPSSDQA